MTQPQSVFPFISSSSYLEPNNQGVYELDEIDNSFTENQLSNNYALPQILIISTYPPRECGIATYSQDLIQSLDCKYRDSFQLNICAIESTGEKHNYQNNITFILNTQNHNSFISLANYVNNTDAIKMVLIQHEFGLFNNCENDFLELIYTINKPITICFHTVLPQPDNALKTLVRKIYTACNSVVVMTNTSAKILEADYQLPIEKIKVIPHGTHLVAHTSKTILKKKYHLENKTGSSVKVVETGFV